MTEKRFECGKGSRIIIDNETKLHYIMTLDWECSLVTKLLNRFADENEQLKSRIEYLERKMQRERNSTQKQYAKWEKEAETKIKELSEENEQLKKVLGAILLEVKQDITNTNQTGEIKAFINPNSFEMISEVLRKYGALKDWYE